MAHNDLNTAILIATKAYYNDTYGYDPNEPLIVHYHKVANRLTQLEHKICAFLYEILSHGYSNSALYNRGFSKDIINALAMLEWRYIQPIKQDPIACPVAIAKLEIETGLIEGKLINPIRGTLNYETWSHKVEQLNYLLG
jgi:hypothetical protein